MLQKLQFSLLFFFEKRKEWLAGSALLSLSGMFLALSFCLHLSHLSVRIWDLSSSFSLSIYIWGLKAIWLYIYIYTICFFLTLSLLAFSCSVIFLLSLFFYLDALSFSLLGGDPLNGRSLHTWSTVAHWGEKAETPPPRQAKKIEPKKSSA